MNYELKSKTAIVTGGTLGIGRAIVDLLLEQGARVAVCARNKKRLDDLQKKQGQNLLARSVDLEKPDEISDFVKAAIQQWGNIDLLFFNPPPLEKRRISQMDEKEWDQSYQALFKGMVKATETVLPGMKKNKGGSIVVISSLTSIEPVEFLTASSVFRSGINAWIKLMAKEYGKFGIRTNAILPGYIQSDRLDQLAKNEAKEKGIEVEAVYQEWGQSIPLGRVGKTEEIAQAAVFLASPAASYITGTTLLVDGGLVRGI